jgi:hypothetical protein
MNKASKRLIAISALTLLLSAPVAIADDGGLSDPPGKLQQVIVWIMNTLTHPLGRVQK